MPDRDPGRRHVRLVAFVAPTVLPALAVVACNVEGPKQVKDTDLCSKPQISAGRQITEAISAPDGYVPVDSKQYLIVVKNPDGLEGRIEESSSARLFVSLSPNGEQVAFIKDSEIHITKTDGTEERQVTNLAGNTDVALRLTRPAWSPDGNSIAYALKKRSGSFVSVLNLQTGHSRDLTGYSSPEDISGISWAPDGKIVGYVAQFHSDINGDRNSYLKLYFFKLINDSNYYSDFGGRDIGFAPQGFYDTRTHWSPDMKTFSWDICQNASQ